jgi:F0F1-type ATP synthase assembly protein I
VVEFVKGSSAGELLAYCLAFGIIAGVTLGFLIGSLARNSFIGPMGAAVGLFIGLESWFVLSESN